MKTQGLVIRDLHISVIDQRSQQETALVKGIDLQIKPGEVHVIMGPNGSGKSTLAYTLAGHPFYTVHKTPQTEISIDGEEIGELAPDERAARGLFLAFQYPVEVPGVKIQNFLRQAHQARFATEPKKLFPTVLAFREHLQKLAQELRINPELLKRGLNEGFSGGEKKRIEILQMALLQPKYAVLDETDSGLDVDALRAVAEGVQRIVKKHHTGVILITHYQRILKYVQPDVVHVMHAGKIVRTGGPELASQLEAEGYEKIVA